ncbi:MAG: hypothetical protein LQ352_008296 [Teloschistes flavicans]|nr:MAG: hypothetical protein LQ352_008296 [Teloschistes flavicans]
MSINTAPNIMVPPANACPPTKSFVSTWTSKPAIGLPVRSPNAATNKLMPIQVPTTGISGVKDTSTGGARETYAPAKKPYRTANMTENAGRKRARYQKVHRTRFPDQECWEDSPEEGAGVEDGQQVEGVIRVDAAACKGVHLNVEHGDIEPYKANCESDAVEGVRPRFKGGGLEQGSGRFGWKLRPHGHNGRQIQGERDEADDASCPSKA